MKEKIFLTKRRKILLTSFLDLGPNGKYSHFFGEFASRKIFSKNAIFSGK